MKVTPDVGSGNTSWATEPAELTVSQGVTVKQHLHA